MWRGYEEEEGKGNKEDGFFGGKEGNEVRWVIDKASFWFSRVRHC